MGFGGWVCLTGGEPVEQDDFAAVIAACRNRGLRVNLQTSGMRAMDAAVDWCTVSPKAPADALVMQAADELKVVYTGQSIDELRDYYEKFSAWNYYLQPAWRDGRGNETETLERVYELNRLGMYWEFTAQWHKHLGVR